MVDKFLIDECLNAGLVAVAKDRGLIADYAPHIGKGGWSDWRIVMFALDNDYIVVTNNRRHFLKEYLKVNVHNGLIVIIPNVERQAQLRLFKPALDRALELGADLTNRLVEVLDDGAVHVREWTSEKHDISHIAKPRWP